MNLSLLSEGFSEFLPKDEVYLSCISDLLENKYVVKMNSFIQHGHTTCLMHCVSVSYRSYCCARAFGLDYKSAARAGLLHDLFLYDWHKLQKNSWHGFTHPAIALKNANEH
ncbi:MAG: HD family phosphohydrolase, partial [Oscillospiraceae bacterium]